MDKVKEGQRQKRALKRQTMKVIKMAKDTVGDLALPWNEIVSMVPRIAEHVEALEANIRMDKMSVADNLVRSGGSVANGLYKSDYDKYLALKNRQELSPDERSWRTE